MIVGFTITDFKGHEQEAIEYIRKVCILEDPSIANNIVDAGPGVNVYSKAVKPEELSAESFSATLIETQPGKFIIASKVNFNLELLYNADILRLVPTEYVYVADVEVYQFLTYEKQGLIKIMPAFNDKYGSDWILESGCWDDAGVWYDVKNWKDIYGE